MVPLLFVRGSDEADTDPPDADAADGLVGRGDRCDLLDRKQTKMTEL